MGECRILCALFHLLMAPSGSCLESLLQLRFGYVRVSLACDPEGGPYQVVICFILEYTKGFLGVKDAYVLF